MTVQHQEVYALPANLYITGSPVLILAGSLLKDIQTEQICIRLSMKNIGPKPIKAVYVSLQPYDPAGRPLGGELSFTYLDLNTPRDGVFGTERLNLCPNHTTRSFTVRISEVIFTDNTVWSSQGAVWAALPAQQSLMQAYHDAELCKQFQLRFGTGCAFYPDRLGDLCRCTCGAVNRAEEQDCHACGRRLDDLLSVSTNDLTEEKNARLAREQAEREAQAAAAQKAAEERTAKRAATAKKVKRVTLIVAVALLVSAILILATIFFILPSIRYSRANALMERGEYEKAVELYEALDGFRDSDAKLAESSRLLLISEGKFAEAAIEYYNSGDKNRAKSFDLWGQAGVQSPVASGYDHTVAVLKDGICAATGYNGSGGCDVSGWTDIIAVACGEDYTVGLRADGTVVAIGKNDLKQCSVSGWKEIVAIACGNSHTVGICANGTVIAAGNNTSGQCDVSGWTDIIDVACGYDFTVGLRADGTIVFAGDRTFFEDSPMSKWDNIVAIAAGSSHTVGLRADGTLVAAGNNDYGQCDCGDWSDITAVACGFNHTVGLREDGTVVAVGNNSREECDVSGWSEIVAVGCGRDQTFGLRANGTVVAVGDNDYDECAISDWKNIRQPSSKKS